MRKLIKVHVSKAIVIACAHGIVGGMVGVAETVYEMGVMDNHFGKGVMSSCRKLRHQLKELTVKEREPIGDLGAKELA